MLACISHLAVQPHTVLDAALYRAAVLQILHDSKMQHAELRAQGVCRLQHERTGRPSISTLEMWTAHPPRHAWTHMHAHAHAWTHVHAHAHAGWQHHARRRRLLCATQPSRQLQTGHPTPARKHVTVNGIKIPSPSQCQWSVSPLLHKDGMWMMSLIRACGPCLSTPALP